MILQVAKRTFSVTDFQRMAETGILTETDRCELLNGEIINMSPIGRKHAAKVNRLSALLNQCLGNATIVGIQNPIELGPFSQPQPDIAVLRKQDDFYESGHPEAIDIYLLIEVADTTLETDRSIKLPLYAEAGIQEVWIVNIPDNQIEVYCQPIDNQYTQTKIVISGQTLTISAFPEITIEANQII